MASNNKRKTTMAKLNRERKLIEKRVLKAERKRARKAAAAEEAANPSEPQAEEEFAPEAAEQGGP